MGKRAKLTDVAKFANVSTAVVSSVINHKQGTTIRVSPETTIRVLAAVQKLGYVPNVVARSLAQGRNHILGVFTHESIFPVDQRSFYHPFLLGIEEEAENYGYDLLLFSSARTADGKRRIYGNSVNRLQVADGAILLGREENKDEISQLIKDEYPFVYVGRREVPVGSLSYVAADYASATIDVVEHLLRFGHRKLMLLGSQAPYEPVFDRQEGFVKAHRTHGLPLVPEYRTRVTPEALSAEMLLGWLEQGTTAFVIEDDTLAKPFLQLAKCQGLCPPQDFSLAVLGDPLEMDEDIPDWTTFKIPRRDMGRQAVRLLIEILGRANPVEPHVITLPCRFVPGQTSGPLHESRRKGAQS